MWKLVQSLIGLGLMIFAYVIGHASFDLQFGGHKAVGTIVDYRDVSAQKSSYKASPTFQPVVRFEANGRTYEFQDHVGMASADGKGESVSVYFDPENPQVAMVDNQLKNYIPWGPMFLIGLVLFLGGINSRKTIMIVDPGPVTLERVQTLVREGRKIEAIKMYRKLTGVGLKEAKDYVDRIQS